ncbi:retinol dehydrogenase 2-like, partial [Python bivittatus]|uniref:Retinol dehydrogenase 2-like n=1 Tax=Python bivittatus TaxID=176946 RepID=A0A9F2RDX6_PYTBI
SQSRQEMQTLGVHVSMVEPGFFSTHIYDFLEESLQRIWHQLAPDIQESYGQKLLKMYCKTMQFLKRTSGKNLRLVTDCIEHALMSHHPRARYSAGWDAKLLFLPASYLPSWVVDW